MSDNPRKQEPPPEADPPPADAEPPEAEPTQAEPAEADRKSLEEQIAQAKEEAQKYLANWQRAEADFQNYKRRVEQERDETRRFASAALIINVLPILDDLERALMSLDTRLAGLTWFEGIALIHRKILILLENAGVGIIQAEGQQFDPRYHEAVTHSEGEEGKVLAEVQRGYKLYDRVLRPAMVVVGKAKEEEKEREEKAPEGGEPPAETGNTEQEGEHKEDEQS
ncbi:MAG: nucleotide exchange factor GrpE [Dehalococcoidia bacterium]|nr:MAG: nucleotide exchange factor GrpE [Dehalococcoidia bacterium]